MSTQTFLLGIDLEDVRFTVPNGDSYKERVPAMVERYLDFFAAQNARATFFTVGNVVRAYPELVRHIHELGHEIACHSDSHVPVAKLGPEGFRRDLAAFNQTIEQAGLPRCTGFRAPVLSMLPSTQWAYDILAEFGFKYSSSVLPGKNPLYGWPGFGTEPKKISGLWEMPVSVLPWSALRWPFLSGVYLRMLPKFVSKNVARYYAKRQEVLVGYLHPYDIDEQQEFFMHDGINNSRVYNRLMYYNRGSVFPKLRAFADLGYRVQTYSSFLNERLN